MESVVVVTLPDGEVAHIAMRELCRLHGERGLWVQAATIVQARHTGWSGSSTARPRRP